MSDAPTSTPAAASTTTAAPLLPTYSGFLPRHGPVARRWPRRLSPREDHGSPPTSDLAALRQRRIPRASAERALGVVLARLDVPATAASSVEALLCGRAVAAPGLQANLALAASALLALSGRRVHLVARTEEAAAHLATRAAALAGLVPALRVEGEGAQRAAAYRAPIAITTHRELAFDLLRSRHGSASAPPAARRALRATLAPDPHPQSPLPLGDGFDAAIVTDADLALLDDATSPMALTRPVEDGGLPQDDLAQALAIAQDLSRVEAAQEDPPRLTAAMRARLHVMVAGGSGPWQDPATAEALVADALAVLAGEVRPPNAPPQSNAERMALLQAQGRSDRLHTKTADLLLPELFRRYRHLAATADTFEGAEKELHSLYGLRRAAPASRDPHPHLDVLLQSPEAPLPKDADAAIKPRGSAFPDPPNLPLLTPSGVGVRSPNIHHLLVLGLPEGRRALARLRAGRLTIVLDPEDPRLADLLSPLHLTALGAGGAPSRHALATALARHDRAHRQNRAAMMRQRTRVDGLMGLARKEV